MDSIVVANKSNIVSAYCAYDAKNCQFIVVAKKKAQTTATQKNVTPKEIQDEVNAYIKSKGFILDPTLTPSTAGWDGQISRQQKYLNDGTTLKSCKFQVDSIAQELDPSRVAAYCYYDSDSFYVLYT